MNHSYNKYYVALVPLHNLMASVVQDIQLAFLRDNFNNVNITPILTKNMVAEMLRSEILGAVVQVSTNCDK